MVETTSCTEARELLGRLERMNDPIGLAGKPLFLDMLKQIMGAKELPGDLDIVTLYERCIDLSFHRKRELLDDSNLSLPPDKIIKNLRVVLGEIAEQLQRSGEDYLLLRKLTSGSNQPFAELLWRLSGPDELSEDARSRIGARSLLGRVVREDLEEEWPVDFCHRSMREYFVAVRLCEAVETGFEAGEKFLKEVPLNHEILEFAAERWRKHQPRSVKENLLAVVERALPSTNPGRLGGCALTLLYRIESMLPRDFSRKGKVFDGADLESADLSGLDFRGSSFRYANLGNVNFERANLELCDLTGVRIEETAPVMSIGRDPSGEKLVAVYRDGVLRQWHLKPGGKIPSKVIGNMALQTSCAVGLHECGQPWLQNGREWIFFVRGEDETWSRPGGFRIKDAFDGVRVQQKLLIFTEKDKEEGVRLVVVDLNRQRKLCSIQTNPTRHCATLGTDAVVWSDAKIGFRVKSLAADEGRNELLLQCQEPSCLDVFRLRGGVYLVGGGTGDGHVHVWKVDLQNGARNHDKVLEAKPHQGAVTAIAFVDNTRLSSGGEDCAIVVSRWTQGSSISGTAERRLRLKFRCHGLKIVGLKSEIEYGLLAKLIEESENPGLP